MLAKRFLCRNESATEDQGQPAAHAPPATSEPHESSGLKFLVVPPQETEIGGRCDGGIMSSLAASVIVFACVFGGVLLGVFLRTALPEHHLNADSRTTVNLGMGMISTMAALGPRPACGFGGKLVLRSER